jgi:hypothetical protein
MSESWQRFLWFADLASAQTVAGLLQLEGVPVREESCEAISGFEKGFWLLVPENLSHRARWVLAQSEVSDRELSYLATGKLGDTNE